MLLYSGVPAEATELKSEDKSAAADVLAVSVDHPLMEETSVPSLSELVKPEYQLVVVVSEERLSEEVSDVLAAGLAVVVAIG